MLRAITVRLLWPPPEFTKIFSRIQIRKRSTTIVDRRKRYGQLICKRPCRIYLIGIYVQAIRMHLQCFRHARELGLGRSLREIRKERIIMSVLSVPSLLQAVPALKDFYKLFCSHPVLEDLVADYTTLCFPPESLMFSTPSRAICLHQPRLEVLGWAVMTCMRFLLHEVVVSHSLATLSAVPKGE